MSLYVENLKKNGKLSAAIVLSVLGATFNFISVCLKQSTVTNLPSGSLNPYALEWYMMFFYFFVAVSLLVVSATDSFTRYRLASLALVAISISYIPPHIDSNISLSKSASDRSSATVSIDGVQFPIGSGASTSADSSSNKLAAAGGLAAAGLIMIVLPFFAILGWLGSDADAPVNNVAESLKIITVSQSKDTVSA